jgi:RNA polymerase sigma-70 factor, ECF subfamily
MTPIRNATETVGWAGASAPDVDAGRTSSTLLNQVRDWNDRPAWDAFFDRYDPLLRSWCRRHRLIGDSADELSQRIWIELMARMRTFHYDPSRGFRRWLWRLFRSRAVDALRHRLRTHGKSLEGALLEDPLLLLSPRAAGDDGEDEGPDCASTRLLRLACSVQESVRSRVDPATWRAFEMIAVEDRAVGEVAAELGKKYTAVYNGYKRVNKMLREEGQRHLARRSNESADYGEID